MIITEKILSFFNNFLSGDLRKKSKKKRRNERKGLSVLHWPESFCLGDAWLHYVYCHAEKDRLLGITSFLSAFATALRSCF